MCRPFALAPASRSPRAFREASKAITRWPSEAARRLTMPTLDPTSHTVPLKEGRKSKTASSRSILSALRAHQTALSRKSKYIVRPNTFLLIGTEGADRCHILARIDPKAVLRTDAIKSKGRFMHTHPGP